MRLQVAPHRSSQHAHHPHPLCPNLHLRTRADPRCSRPRAETAHSRLRRPNLAHKPRPRRRNKRHQRACRLRHRRRNTRRIRTRHNIRRNRSRRSSHWRHHARRNRRSRHTISIRRRHREGIRNPIRQPSNRARQGATRPHAGRSTSARRRRIQRNRHPTSIHRRHPRHHRLPITTHAQNTRWLVGNTTNRIDASLTTIHTVHPIVRRLVRAGSRAGEPAA